ncbi:MAG: PGF-pre-PGF domain-containing protein, partial [Candidatus Aenigmatarchaeota archaeon]
DLAGNSNSLGINITMDATIPGVVINSPANNTFINTSGVNITVSDANTNYTNISIINLIGSVVNSTTRTPNGTYVVDLGVVDGVYNISVITYDLAGNSNSSVINITLDTTSPVINYTTPTLATSVYTNVSYVNVNMTVNETNFYNLTFRLYNSTGGLLNSTTYNVSTETIINYTALGDGLYYYNTTVTDGAGNSASTSTRSITVDATIPGVVINSPANNSNQATLNIIVNLTISDANINYTNISIINSTGSVVNTTTNTTNGTYVVSLGMVDGVYNISITGYDLAGNSNTTSGSGIIVDSTAPIVSNITPGDVSGSIIPRNYTYLNFSANDSTTNISTCWAEFTNTTNNATNYTMTMSANGTDVYCYINMTNLADGSHNYTVRANDSLGNVGNSTLFRIIIDTTAPAMLNYSPNTSTTSSKTLWFTSNENATCRYSATNGTAYENMSNMNSTGGTEHNLTLTGLTAGTKTYYVLCNDTAGNTNNTEFNVTLVVTLSTTTTTTTTGGGGGSSITASASASFGFDVINANTPVSISPKTVVSNIEITTNSEVKNANFGVTKLDTNPVSEAPSIITYKYISVTHNVDNSKFTSAKLAYSVEKSWIDENNIVNVYLERYESSAWKRYDGVFVDENSTHKRYYSITPGLSYFAIGGESVVECADGMRCSVNQLEECVNSKWVVKESCQYGCVDGVCKSAPVGVLECTEGKRCLYSELQKCVNNKWVNSESCAYGCDKQALICKSANIEPIQLPTEVEPEYVVVVIASILIVVIILLMYVHTMVDHNRKKNNL